MPILKAGVKCTQRGFTLIEALVAIVILAALTAVVVPGFKVVYENTILKTTARELAGIIRFTRARAISLNQTLSLRYDFDAKYFVSDAESLIELPGALEVNHLSTLTLPEGNQLHVTFYPHGGSNGADFVMHNQKRYFLFELNPITGRVSVKDYAPN